MPMYDLKCQKCGRVDKDVFFKHSGQLDWKCKKCKHKKFAPLPPVFSFKIEGGTPKFHGGK